MQELGKTNTGGDEADKAPFLESMRCSFCCKRGTEVESLIAGPTPQIAICNECIELCVEILTEQRADRES
jgi:hypothetical protein